MKEINVADILISKQWLRTLKGRGEYTRSKLDDLRKMGVELPLELVGDIYALLGYIESIEYIINFKELPSNGRD